MKQNNNDTKSFKVSRILLKLRQLIDDFYIEF